MALDVVTFGESMVMFIADELGELHEVEHFTRALAGAETNVSTGLARLGYKVGWMSKVGEDTFGKYIMETVKKEGIDISCVKVDGKYRTGFQLKSKTLSGDPKVQYFRKGSAASTISKEDISYDYITSARHLHATGIIPATSITAREYSKEILRIAKESNMTISFDPNLRPSLWSNEKKMIRVVNELAVQADIVLPGISEGKILTGCSKPRDIANYYLCKGVKMVVIKLGAEGAYYRTATEEAVVPGFEVKKVIDTVGAGDGFAVGVISGLLDGLPLDEAVLRGNAIGALAVMAPGDMDGLPTREQLHLFINKK